VPGRKNTTQTGISKSPSSSQRKKRNNNIVVPQVLDTEEDDQAVDSELEELGSVQPPIIDSEGNTIAHNILKTSVSYGKADHISQGS
jgi:hypothetical protein